MQEWRILMAIGSIDHITGSIGPSVDISAKKRTLLKTFTKYTIPTFDCSSEKSLHFDSSPPQ